MSEFTAHTQFKEKIDMSQLWLMHVNRTNLASGDMIGVYDAYVRQQLRLLPLNMQTWVTSQEDSYIEEVKSLKFKQTKNGTKLGYSDNPLVWNKNRTELGLSSESGFSVKRIQGEIDWDDPNIIDVVNEGTEEEPDWQILVHDESKPIKRHIGEIDWSDPLIYSPTLETETEIDYEKFNLLIMAAAEKAGLSWNIEQHTYDLGDVKKGKKKRSQHPLRKTATGHTYQDTPTGFDTRIISEIHDYPGYHVINWHGTQIIEGTGYSPLFLDLVQARTNTGNGTIIGIGGAPGDGKTYTGMRLGEIFSRANNTELNPYINIPFSQEHALWLLDPDETPLKPGDVVVLDEAHFAASARDWFKEDNKEFINVIASARNYGLIVIVVVLHIDMLDKFLRKFTMAFYIHMEKQGTSTTYKTFTPRFSSEMIKNRIGLLTLQLPWVGDCEHPRCLKCKNLSFCNVGRAIYERRKKKMQAEKIQASRERREKISFKRPTREQRFEVFEKHKDTIEYTNQGNISSEWVNNILAKEFEGYTVSMNVARNYGKEWTLSQKLDKKPEN